MIHRIALAAVAVAALALPRRGRRDAACPLPHRSAPPRSSG